MKNSIKCVLCAEAITGLGHNAEPVGVGECCRKCNLTRVLPQRIAAAHTARRANAFFKRGATWRGKVKDLDEVVMRNLYYSVWGIETCETSQRR